MAKAGATKPAELNEEKEFGSVFGEGVEGVCITKTDLYEALEANMMHKLGQHPIEGQFEDLWRRVSQG